MSFGKRYHPRKALKAYRDCIWRDTLFQQKNKKSATRTS